MTGEPPSGDAPGPVEPGQLTALLRALAVLPEDGGKAGDDPELLPGDVIGRFRILRFVGRGGFGVVYEARDEALRRSVALKTLRRRGPASVPPERLLVEAEAAARLSHPNIVTLHDVGTSDRGPYLVMEYLRGEPLSARLARGPLPPAEAVRIALEVARGLAHAHAHGVVHRDLKPANVFLCAEGTVKVLDFGLAHALGQARMDGGTPAYMAPEQRKGAPEDERTDVFALGVLLHQMLTGQRPFGAAGGSALQLRPPVLEIAASPALSELVARMLERDPTRRPRDGAEVATSLAAIQRELDSSPSTPSGPIRARRRWRLALGVAAASLATALAVRLLWPGSPAPPPPAGRLALADVANDTGEPELEVSGLLRTVIEQSTTLHVIPRVRLLDALRQSRRDEVVRLDEPAATEAAHRTGAAALLLAHLLRFGDRYVLDVRVVDPATAATRFSFKLEESGKEGVPDLIDRAGEQVRLQLGEDPGAIRSRAMPARSVTASLAAWRHYAAGMTCYERRAFAGSFDPCLAEMGKAVEIDPGFALADLQIAKLLFLSGRPRALQKEALERAQRHRDRVPPVDRPKLDGWVAFVDGQDARAKALFEEAARAAPDDKIAWFLAAEIRYHRDEFAEALPFLRRVVALDPSWLGAGQHLAFALGVTGDRVGLRARAAELAALGARPDALTALCYVQAWLDPAMAVADCRRAREAGAEQLVEEWLAISLLETGDRAALDAHVRALLERRGTGSFFWYMSLWLLGQEGRWAEVLRAEQAGLEAQPALRDSSWFHVTMAELLLGSGDADLAWREAMRVLELDRTLLSAMAVQLAYAGDLARAAELREYLPPDSPRVDVYDAVVRWRRGDPAGAAEALRRVAATAAASSDPAVPAPLYLLGEALADAGRDAEAADALRQFQAIPLQYPSWVQPRSRYLLARSLDRLGDREGARDALRPLAQLWRRADPGQPLLADVRSLSSRLGLR